jgi:hypothetical protein
MAEKRREQQRGKAAMGVVWVGWVGNQVRLHLRVKKIRRVADVGEGVAVGVGWTVGGPRRSGGGDDQECVRGKSLAG